VFLGKQVGNTTVDNDLESCSPPRGIWLPPLLVERPGSSPSGYVVMPAVDNDYARRTIGDTAPINSEKVAVLGSHLYRDRREKEQYGIRGRQPARPRKIGESTFRRWRFTEGDESNPFTWIAPTYEERSLHCIGSEHPLHASEHPFDSLRITRWTAPQRDFTTCRCGHFLGNEAEALYPSRVVELELVMSTRCSKPSVKLPAKSLDDERRTPWSVMAPAPQEALSFAHDNLAEQQRTRTTISGQRAAEFLGETFRGESELVDD
jgi:hypothetical protein